VEKTDPDMDVIKQVFSPVGPPPCQWSWTRASLVPCRMFQPPVLDQLQYADVDMVYHWVWFL